MENKCFSCTHITSTVLREYQRSSQTKLNNRIEICKYVKTFLEEELASLVECN